MSRSTVANEKYSDVYATIQQAFIRVREPNSNLASIRTN